MSGMGKTWESRAALYELLARTFLFTERDMASALVSGEYGEALLELLEVNGIGAGPWADLPGELERYREKDEDEVFHALRGEYTRLYLSPGSTPVVPYAGTWAALERGQKPLMFIGKESMAVERFMRKCGIARGGNSNDPLDHIGTMLEFLMHLCTLKAGIVRPAEGFDLAEGAYEAFYEEHFIDFARALAAGTAQCANEAFFVVGARVLSALPSKSL